MTQRVIFFLCLPLLAGCSSVPRLSIGNRGEPTPWDAARVRELGVEVETLVARAARRPEEEVVEQVGMELEFGEEEVDPGALLGGAEELSYEAPLLADFHIDTADVAAAVRSRQLRASALREWKDRGCVGENPQGMVAYVRCQACEDDPILADRLSFLIIKENRNRRFVYDSLLKANRWPNSRLRDVRAAFAAAIKDLSAPADLFQVEGEWMAKDSAAAEAVATARPAARPRPRRPVENWEQAEVFEPDGNSLPPRVIPQR